MTAPQELGQARWDMAREPLAGCLKLLRWVPEDPVEEPHSKRLHGEQLGDLRAEEVDWTALHRKYVDTSIVEAGSAHFVKPLRQHNQELDPFAVKVQMLIKQLSAESKASRAVVDEYSALVKAAPADMAKKLLVPLLDARGPAHCELAQVLAKDCLTNRELLDLSFILLQREDVQWSDEFILFWQKGLLPGLGEVSSPLLHQLLVSLETASQSPKLAGLLFLICKMAGPAIHLHAAACRRIAKEKCSGPLVAQIMKLL